MKLVRGPSALTLATSIVAQGLTMISGILAARALGVEGRGALAVLWLIPVTLVLLGGIGIPQATTFYVAKELGNAKGVARLSIRLTLVIAIVLTGLYSLGLVVFLGDGDAAFTLLEGFLSVALVPMFLAHNLGWSVLLGLKRYRAYNLARIIPVFIYAMSVLGLFVAGEATLTLILVGMLASWVAAAVMTWYLVSRNFPSSSAPVEATTRGIASFGLRGVIGSVSPIDDVRADQLMVGALLDTRALGLYVAALAFCNFPRFIAQSIGSIAFPRIASARDRVEAWAIAGRAVRAGLVTILGCVAILFVALPVLLPLLFGDDFSPAVSLGRILLVAAFFLAFHRLLTELARGLGHPGYGSITELVNLTVFLAGILAFATPASTHGVAYAVLAGGFAASTLLALLLRRLKNLELPARAETDQTDGPEPAK
jgi:O-antigen/teichoic acid export membrane protein